MVSFFMGSFLLPVCPGFAQIVDLEVEIERSQRG